MAKTVVEKTLFDQSTYHEGIVPSQDPMNGFGSSVAFWAYLLGIFEGRLENIDPLYAVFDVTKAFARRSRGAAIRESNNQITIQIHHKLSAASGVDDEE